jgi:ComF family protein
MFELIKRILDLIFPEYCASCNVILQTSEKAICPSCIQELPQSFHSYIKKKSLKGPYGELIARESMSLYELKSGSQIERLIYSLKYKDKQIVGAILGRKLGEKMKDLSFSKFDMIIPIPLHKKKLKKRGYNQSLIIADEVSKVIGTPVNIECTVRLKNTDTQTNKSRLERYENLNGAFNVVNKLAIKGKHILIIDDVITTGATIQSLAKELLANGATKISFATLAQATNFPI